MTTPFSMPIFGENLREFHQLSPAEKRLNWNVFVARLLRILTDFQPSRFPNRGGIHVYNLFLSQDEFRRVFPDLEQLPFPEPPAPFAANATNAAVKCWEIESRLLEALSDARSLMLNLLTTQCREEVKHLQDETSGFVNVSVQALFQAAYDTHGQLTPVDHEALRMQTTKPFNRAEPLINNIGGWTQAHQRLAKIGPGHTVSNADKLREITLLLRAYHPSVAEMVTFYEQDTDVLTRSWSDLVDFVKLKVLRLTVPLHGGSRGFLNAAEEESATDDGPSAAAAQSEPKPTAGSQVSISKVRLKELEDAETFAKAAPTPQYCFSCGWGSHTSPRCGRMSTRDGSPRDGFTKAQIEAKKPATVDGKSGSTKLKPGFRKPN